MTITKRFKILSPRHIAAGISIREEADDFVYLLKDGQVKATFTPFVTLEELRAAADELEGINAEVNHS